MGRKYDAKTKSKVYDYDVDKAVVDENSRTFRENNLNHYSLRVDTFRPKQNVTPYKPKIKTNFASPDNYNTNNSGRKKVRFVESVEVMLKTVPIDPTFNDLDFVHEMKHI